MTIETWIYAAKAGDAEFFFNASVPWNFSPAFIAGNPRLLVDARKRYEFLDFAAVTRLCEYFLNVNLTPKLAGIKCPTCILVGSLDILKSPVYASILENGIPHVEQHILQGAGHASCWERPQEFNSAILGFLAKL
jgi:pimeloyl-ACP methyl ester carboxylesterase